MMRRRETCRGVRRRVCSPIVQQLQRRIWRTFASGQQRSRCCRRCDDRGGRTAFASSTRTLRGPFVSCPACFHAAFRRTDGLVGRTSCCRTCGTRAGNRAGSRCSGSRRRGARRVYCSRYRETGRSRAARSFRSTPSMRRLHRCERSPKSADMPKPSLGSGGGAGTFGSPHISARLACHNALQVGRSRLLPQRSGAINDLDFLGAEPNRSR